MGTVGEPGAYLQPWLSPDEKRVVFDRYDIQTGTADLWIMVLARGIATRFTFDPKSEFYPVWSSDGGLIVYMSSQDSGNYLYQKEASGIGQERPLLTSPSKLPTDWSVDGRFLLYSEFAPKTTNVDLWVLPLADKANPIPFLRTKFTEGQGAMSPDSKWIAYQSDESGRPEVNVQPFPATGAKWQVSNGGGRFPKWRRDGKELFYLGTDPRMMAVPVEAGVVFQPGVPVPLFDTGITNPRIRYAVTHDGQRFLFPAALETGPSPATVVLNWTAGIRK